jgi:hypothetical protein
MRASGPEGFVSFDGFDGGFVSLVLWYSATLSFSASKDGKVTVNYQGHPPLLFPAIDTWPEDVAVCARLRTLAVFFNVCPQARH